MQTQESKADLGKTLDADLVVIESSGTESGKQNTSNSSGIDADADNGHIKLIYNKEPMAERFAITALKNELRKLKGNSMDTKFTKPSVLGKPIFQSLRNQSVVRQPNAFKSERPKISKPRFASQVGVKKDFPKPITQHYLTKGKESALSKPHHMIASSPYGNSSKNMPRLSSNDMVHNQYLNEARKKTKERDRNLKYSVMPSTRCQSTADGSKPKPRSSNQSIRNWPTSKSSCVTLTVVPKADHSRNSSPFSDSKHFVQSNKTRNNNKPVEQKSHTQKPGRQIFTGHRLSPNKTFVVYEKTSPRSDLRWKPMGRIFKTVGLRWDPTRKLFDSCTSKADSESTHGSNVDISKIQECKQALDFCTCTSINVQKKQSFDLNAGTSYNVKQDNLRVWLLKKMISHKPVLKWIQN
ncbi:hypothetical protein Tco_0392917 [Tanacetum coccineum]